MQTNTMTYQVEKSVGRIEDILSESNSSFEELVSIPDRSRLTFTNGFYITVGAVFVDLRGSSALTGEHRRPRLAKIYRSYISECVAILNGHGDCREVNITGDCVSGIFEARYQYQIGDLLEAAAQLNSLIPILNWKYAKYGIVNVTAGIGVAYGRALMVKAGYSGSAINEVVWMGDVVNEASNLCAEAGTYGVPPVLIDEDVYLNLKDEYKGFFTQRANGSYGGYVINLEMDKWLRDNS